MFVENKLAKECVCVCVFITLPGQTCPLLKKRQHMYVFKAFRKMCHLFVINGAVFGEMFVSAACPAKENNDWLL